MRKIISMILSVLMIISTFSVTAFATTSADDIRFDFTADTQEVTVAGDSGATASWKDGQLILSVSTASDLACKKIGFTLPSKDLGEGGYYLHVKSNYKFTGDKTGLGTQFVVSGSNTIVETEKAWDGSAKINTYDITSLTGEQSLSWLLQFTDEANGTANVNVAWAVLSKNATITDAEEDIRFDFISDVEGASAGSNSAKSVVWENGECILTSNSQVLNKSNIRLALPQIDLGEGGYYMYVKSKYAFTEGTGLLQTFVFDGTVNHGTSGNTWDGYYVRKIDISSLTGNQNLKLTYQTTASSATGTGVINIDWIVLSKNPNLKENVSIVDSLSDGINDISLKQDTDLTEAIVAPEVYDALVAGTTNALPNGFSATLASNASDVTYKTTITDKTTYKVVDIFANGFVDGAAYVKSYRIKFAKEVTVKSDIRLDFVSNLEGAVNAGAISKSIEAVNGEAVVTGSHTKNNQNEKLAIRLPFVNLGEGGYYMYAKVRHELPDSSNNKWSSVKYEYRSDENAAMTDNTLYSTDPDRAWTGYKIIKIDTSKLTNLNQVQLSFIVRQTEATGDVKVYVDWVVFSQDALFDETTSILTSINDGSKDYALGQNGDITEVEFEQNVYASIVAGTTNGLPTGLTATPVNGASDVKYNTTVTVSEDYKTIDVVASGILNGSPVFRTYRIIAKAKADYAPDIRLDFTNDLDDAIAAGEQSGNKSTIASVNGEAVVTGIHTSGKQGEKVAIRLPFVNLGEGGYYMYAKVRHELPDSSTNKWSSVQYEYKNDEDAAMTSKTLYSTDPDRAWTGYKIIKIDTSKLTNLNQVQLSFIVRQTEATGNVKVYVDWVVFSQKETAPTNEYLSLGTSITVDEETSTWTGTVSGEMEHSTNSKSGKFYFAGFDAFDCLVDCLVVDMTFDGSSDANFATQSQSLTDDDIAYAKVFVWDADLTPFCEAYKFPNE